MRLPVLLAPEAADDLKRLRAYDRARVRAELERLRVDPTRVGSSRIKRLRGLRKPQYRLRVGDVRVFYDVTGEAIEVLAVVPKTEAQAWLDREGEKQ
jgi:mRNA-degrading endonuclease RelE of RelBE toxin-antitoxin system